MHAGPWEEADKLSQVLAGPQAHRWLLGLTATLDQGIQSGGRLVCLCGMVTTVLQQLD